MASEAPAGPAGKKEKKTKNETGNAKNPKMNPFCRVCYNLRPQNDNQSWTKETEAGREIDILKIDCRKLLKSKGKGCQICFAIFRGMELFTEEVRMPALINKGRDMKSFIRRLTEQDGSKAMISLREGHPAVVSVCFKFPKFPELMEDGGVRKRRKPPVLFCFEIYTIASPGTPWPITAFGRGRHLPSKPRSDCRIRLIKEWMASCEADHINCSSADLVSSKSDGFVPRRLLDLSGNPRSRIKLVDGKDAAGGNSNSRGGSSSSVVRYATLSHPGWRDSPDILRITTQNLAEAKSSIRWDDLPAAWKDAVAVVSEQNIRYLWIDCLCVLQDSDEDLAWYVEHIGDIFGASCLTIACTRINEVGESFLGHRTAGTEIRGKVRYAEYDKMKHHEIKLSYMGYRFPVYLRLSLCPAHRSCGLQGCRLGHHFPPEMMRNGPPGQPNHKPLAPQMASARAFVERMLARRLILFHGSEMLWECRSCTKCECNLSELPISNLRGPTGAGGGAAALRSQLPHGNASRSDMIGMWQRVMYIYPFLCMPGEDETHRLALLSSFADVARRAARMDVFAGLFANDRAQFARELLWQVYRLPEFVSSPDSVTFKCRSPQMPSWSWVSIIAIGSCISRLPSGFHVHRDFEVVEVEHDPLVGLATAARPGASSWRLDVRGRLLLGKISPKFRRHQGQSFVPAADALLDYFIPPSSPNTSPQQFTSARQHHILHQQMLQLQQAANESGPPVEAPIPAYDPPRSPGSPTEQAPRPDSEPLYEPSNPLPIEPPNRAAFNWDCDLWADEPRPSREPILAYFLLLGRLKPPVNMYANPNDWGQFDVGLVLRRSTPAPTVVSGSGSRVMPIISSNFVRIGTFSVPTRKMYFDRTQAQFVSIV